MKGSPQYGILITLVVFLNINFPTLGQEKSSQEGLGWKTSKQSSAQFSQSFTQDTDNDGIVNALDNCPTKANPNPAAAPSARISGLIGRPCESSGPLAKNAPTIASAAPIERIRDKRSPLTKKA